MVEAFAALVVKRQEFGRAVLELNAGEKLLLILDGKLAHRAHGVLALHFIAGMHESVGKRPGSREDEEPFGVEVQTTHCNPAAARHARQMIKYARTAFRVVAGHDLSGGLVIEQHARRFARLLGRTTHKASLHADDVKRAHAVAELCGRPVHRDDARFNQALHLAPRAPARIGERFLKLFGERIALKPRFRWHSLRRRVRARTHRTGLLHGRPEGRALLHLRALRAIPATLRFVPGQN